jgi:hypothetical protein
MEIIPQEAIDIIDDFINHLSEEQIEEYGRQFLEKQLFLDSFMEVATEELKNPMAVALMYKTYVTMLKCFDYYAIEVPDIPQEFVQTEMMKWAMHVQSINHNFPDKAKIGILKKQVIQKNLVDYIVRQLTEIPDQAAFFRKSEVLPAVMTFFVMVNTMHHYVETLMPPDAE